MSSARFLLLALLLPLLVACAASVPAYVAAPLTAAAGTEVVINKTTNKDRETTVRVKGYVLDSLTCKPVAGVFVGAAEWGNYFGQPQTDSRGHFVLDLLLSRYQSNRPIIVQTVLYSGHSAIPADPTREITILLHRNNYQLPLDECAGVVDSVRMAPAAALAYPLVGTRLAVFIAGNPEQPASKIHTIGLDLKKLGQQMPISGCIFIREWVLPIAREIF